jgi:hypothetical protein
MCFTTIHASHPQATYPKTKRINKFQSGIPLWALMLDSHNSGVLPRRFRTTHDRLDQAINTSGLAELNMSGSGEFSVAQFQEMLKKFEGLGISPDQVIVVDLRGEPHAYINDMPISWYAVPAWWRFSDPVNEIVADEKKRLDFLSIGQKITLRRVAHKDDQGQPELIDVYSEQVTSLATEAQVVKDAGAQYERITVTDHMRPEDKLVDQFLIFFKSLPNGVWVHFHCHAGHGRTSTFMIMYDILRNPQLSLEAIIDRQVKLGSLDVRHFSKKVSRIPGAKDRYHFIQLFYQYVHAPDGYNVTSWSKWVMKQYGKSNDRSHEDNTYQHQTMAAAAA